MKYTKPAGLLAAALAVTAVVAAPAPASAAQQSTQPTAKKASSCLLWACGRIAHLSVSDSPYLLVGTEWPYPSYVEGAGISENDFRLRMKGWYLERGDRTPITSNITSFFVRPGWYAALRNGNRDTTWDIYNGGRRGHAYQIAKGGWREIALCYYKTPLKQCLK